MITTMVIENWYYDLGMQHFIYCQTAHVQEFQEAWSAPVLQSAVSESLQACLSWVTAGLSCSHESYKFVMEAGGSL